MKYKKKIITFALIFLVIIVSGCASVNENTSLLDEILEKGEITFATEGTYAPFSYRDENNNLVGYDVEIARAVAEKLGVEANFIETRWDGIIAGLDAKRYDAIANQVGITEEREEKYLFSTPYTYSYGVIIVHVDTNDITTFEDLAGKTSAQTTTSNWATIVEEYGAEIVATEGFNQSLELVLHGRADATVNDYVTYLDYTNAHPNSPIKLAATSNQISRSAFLLRQVDSSELQERMNEALRELEEEGILREISIRYFGEDISIEP